MIRKIFRFVRFILATLGLICMTLVVSQYAYENKSETNKVKCQQLLDVRGNISSELVAPSSLQNVKFDSELIYLYTKGLLIECTFVEMGNSFTLDEGKM